MDTMAEVDGKLDMSVLILMPTNDPMEKESQKESLLFKKQI